MRIIAGIISGFLILTFAAPSTANAWYDINAVSAKGVENCGEEMSQFPQFCKPISLAFQLSPYFVKSTGGIATDVGMYRKSGKKWIRVPIKESIALATGFSGVDPDVVESLGKWVRNIFPKQDKLNVPGNYLIVIGKYNRAQWNCSIYNYEVCKWSKGFTSLQKIRFYLDESGISQQQAMQDYKF